MRKLTKILAPALIAATALTAAAPAMAYPTPQRSNAIRAQIDDLQRRIARNDNRGRVSEREAAGLRRDVQNLRYTFQRYNRDGLSNGEFRELNNRIGTIKQRLQYERRDRDGRRY